MVRDIHHAFYRHADTMAVSEWQAAQRLPMLPPGVDLPADDPILAWARRQPSWCWDFIVPWLEIYSASLDRGLSLAALALLAKAIRADISETRFELREASDALVAAWAGFYARWVSAAFDDVVAGDGGRFWMSDAERAELERAERAERQAQRRREDRERRLGSVVHELATRAPNGQLRWRLDHILSDVGRAVGFDVTRSALRRAADALVRSGKARWRTRNNGQPWALVAQPG